MSWFVEFVEYRELSLVDDIARRAALCLGSPQRHSKKHSIKYLYSKVTQLGHTHTRMHTYILFIIFSIRVYHRILSTVRRAIQEDLIVYPF